MRFGLAETTIDKINTVFSGHPAIEKAVLYGSRAKGNYRPGSDIDLTLYGDALASSELDEIITELDELLLPYRIDLSIFDAIDHAKLREHIDRMGVVFYQRADVGEGQGAAVKAGWEKNKLGDVLAVLRNGVNCKQDKDGQGEKISRIESIADATFNPERVGYAELSATEKVRYRLLSGDILFSHINSAIHVGKTAVFDSDKEVYHGVNLLLMRPKPGIVPAYLNYALKLLFQSGYWKRACKQSVNQASVNQQDISKVEIQYPRSLPEQHRIVAILDEAFAGIAIARANAEKNRQNARALFESHLQSVFTARGEEWVEKRLKDVCEKITDGTHQTPTYYDEGVIFLSSRNVTSGKIDWEKIKYIDTKQHIEMHKRVAPRVNDILLAKNGTTGVAAIVDRDVIFDIYVSLALLRAREEILPAFLLYFVNSSVAKEQFNKRLKGSGVPNLHLEEIREVVISFPISLAQQRFIVSELDHLSAETQRLESIYQQKLAALDELKKSLLHQAFSSQL